MPLIFSMEMLVLPLLKAIMISKVLAAVSAALVQPVMVN